MNKQTEIVHLHNHSDGSLLDGLSRIPDILKRAKELGQSAIAITDHGNLYNAWEFYQQAKKSGIKPIIGIEAYITDSIKDKTRKQNHITLLAKNAEGVRTLFKLSSLANIEGYYYYPRIDVEMLCAHNKEIIVLSGCLGGLVSQAILTDDFDKARKYIKTFRDAFKDDFYIEIQDSGIPEQQKTKKWLREFSKEFSVPAVASNDAHYVWKEDAFTQEIILTAGQRKKLSDPVRGYDEFNEENKNGRWKFTTEDYYIKSREELSKIYSEEELDNTIKISSKIDISLPEKKSHIPKFPIPSNISEIDYLIKICSKNWKMLGIDKFSNVDAYKKRMREELADIKDGNLAGYFLIVWDVCRFADENNIRRGDGRGSAVGSLVSYVLGIHSCDPVQYGLIWERFYNSARKGSLPDIDLDIETERREEIFDYLRQKYGENRVFQFITFETYRMKNSIKDIGRVMGFNLELTQEISDSVPFKYKDYEDAINQSAKLKEYSERYPDLFKQIKKTEEVKKNKSSHASAVLICDEDVLETGCIPLSYDAKNKKLITSFDMYTLEDMGYLKLDVLGLKTVSVLKNIEELVNGTK